MTLVPASHRRRIARRSSSTSPAPRSGRADAERVPQREFQAIRAHRAAGADGDGVRRLVPGLGHIPGHGKPVVGIDAGTGAPGQPVHLAASSPSARSCGSRRTWRGPEVISAGCTSCPRPGLWPARVRQLLDPWARACAVEDQGVLLAAAGRDREAIRSLEEALRQYDRLGRAGAWRAPADGCASSGCGAGTGRVSRGRPRSGPALPASSRPRPA